MDRNFITWTYSNFKYLQCIDATRSCRCRTIWSFNILYKKVLFFKSAKPQKSQFT